MDAPTPPPPPSRIDVLRRPQTWIAVALLALALLAGRCLLAAPSPPPPAYFDVPAFSLTSHEGRPFGSADLAGKTWIAGFFFTRCPTICPILLQRQEEVRRRTESLGEDLHFVTVSINPVNDTPEAMRAHAESQGLRLQRWTLLTGETQPIQSLVRDGFKEYLVAGPDVAPAEVVHSVRFFLVDGKSRVRGLYDGTIEEEIDRLVRDAERVVERPHEAPSEL